MSIQKLWGCFSSSSWNKPITPSAPTPLPSKTTRSLCTPQSPAKYMQKFAKKYDVPGLHPHKLWHSYAVAAIKSGDDIKTVQENLGHATAAFTLDVYAHVTEQMKRDSAQRRMEQFIQSVSA